MEKSNAIKNIERRIREIAKDYELKGYSVIINPAKSKLPKFLKAFEPDLLVKNDIESVVIEVKSTRGGHSAELKQFETLAKVISEHKKWRFELILTNPAEQTLPDIGEVELSLERIKQRVDEARDLNQLKHYEAAFLLAWTTLEASTRLKLDNKETDFARKPTLSLIKNLYSLGLINARDYRRLEDFNKIRNRVVHGFHSPVNKNSIEDLLNIVTYLTGDSKETVMYNWLRGLDLEEYEDIYNLHYAVMYKTNSGLFTYVIENDIIIGCSFTKEKLHLANDAEVRQFLSLIEQEYMNGMDADSWVGFKRAAAEDD